MMGNTMAEFLFYLVHHQTSIENNAYKNNKHVNLQYFYIHRKLNELASTELNFSAFLIIQPYRNFTSKYVNIRVAIHLSIH